ncbi:F-box only protein 7-like [Mya arenaria]|uniref:F-box only protein 7-like n=1 Tax=Mya arenaria TaxID=6604 RepID=UPI0022DF92D0|nr:F-box only protein 7-like [Mya arenaria]
MKFRVRFQGITRIYEVDDGVKDFVTVGDAAATISALFSDNLFSEFELSLNKKDPLERTSTLIGDCGLVGGDLIHVLTDDQNSPSSDSKTKETANSKENIQDTGQGSSSSCDDGSRSSQSESPSMFPHSTSGSSSSKDELTSGYKDIAMTTSDVDMDTEESAVDLAVVQQCLSEPVLCREAGDGQVPALLIEVFQSLQPQGSAEMLAVVLHVLMLETGFTLVQENACSSKDSMVPDSWRQSGYMKITYTFPGCGSQTSCLTVIPTGASLTVHGKVIGSNEVTRQCSLRTEAYVVPGQTETSRCYCDLAKLSLVFKDAISNPLVQDIRTAAGLVDMFGLLALTQEIKLKILSHLDVRSILQTSCVNQELRGLSKDPFIWRRCYFRDFGNRNDNSLSQDWKNLYKQALKARKERRKMMNKMTMIVPPFCGPQNPFSGPSNWMPPVPGGIIGGDYDLYPNFPSSLPGIPGRLGPLPPVLPRPRYDLMGPGVDPGPHPGLLPSRPSPRGRGRGGGMFGGLGPRFF